MATTFHGKKPSKKDETAHLNYMGGNSWDISNPIARLRMAASSCFFGEPQYYQRDEKDKRPKRPVGPVYRSALSGADVKRLRETLNALDPQDWRGKTPAELMESAIDAALDHDPRATLEVAVKLRNEDHIRTTPQVILVRAAHHERVRGTGLVREYGSKIVLRLDEPTVGLAYHTARYSGRPLPNALKKVWAARLTIADEYQLGKYRQAERGVKLVDVVNLVHPGGYRGQKKNEAVGKLVKDELRTSHQTWEAIISQGGSTTANWQQALEVMGHMAMLRNVRNLLEKGVDPALFVDTLIKGAPKGKQLPFRYYSAYKAVEGLGDARVLDAIEQCLMLSLGNLPKFSGRLMSLCDNSGSAMAVTTSLMGTMSIASIANLQGVISGLCADSGHVGIFGDRLDTFKVRKKASVFDQLKKAATIGRGIGGDTENGIWLFWDKAIREEQHWDHVFVFSDMQAGHGGLYGTNPRAYESYRWNKRNIDVPKLINAYRAKVNKNVNVFLVQVAGYQDTIVPEFYERTYILGGWGEGLLRFAAEMANIVDTSKQ
jgi:hypothetical protein